MILARSGTSGAGLFLCINTGSSAALRVNIMHYSVCFTAYVYIIAHIVMHRLAMLNMLWLLVTTTIRETILLRIVALKAGGSVVFVPLKKIFSVPL